MCRARARGIEDTPASAGDAWMAPPGEQTRAASTAIRTVRARARGIEDTLASAGDARMAPPGEQTRAASSGAQLGVEMGAA